MTIKTLCFFSVVFVGLLLPHVSAQTCPQDPCPEPTDGQQLFLTLPFTENAVELTSGWYYQASGCCHRAVDYFPIPRQRPFEVKATADGYAVVVREGESDTYGEYVVQAHDVLDSGALGCGRRVSLYAHLKAGTAEQGFQVPSKTGAQVLADLSANGGAGDFSSWLRVVRGRPLALSGITGASGNSNHLHYESHCGTGLRFKVDPYGIYGHHLAYKPPLCLTKHEDLWTECPPVRPGTVTSPPAQSLTANAPYSVDTGTGVLYAMDAGAVDERVPVGQVGFSSVEALAYNDLTGVLYGFDNATGALISIDRVTGAGELVGLTGMSVPGHPHGFLGDRVEDLAFDGEHVLLGVTSAADAVGRIIEIDPATGLGRLVTTTDRNLLSGIAYHHQTGRTLVYSDEDDQLLEFHSDSATVSVVGDVAVGGERGAEQVRDLTNNPRYPPEFPELYGLMNNGEYDYLGLLGTGTDLYTWLLQSQLGPLHSVSALEYARYPNCAGVGLVDQELEAQQDVCGGSGSQMHLSTNGQEFVPSTGQVSAVEIFLEAWSPPGTASVTVNLREASLDGTMLGTATELVGPKEPLLNFWQRLVFPAPMIVEPGELYVIEFVVTNNSFTWPLQRGDGICEYPKGTALRNGVALGGDRPFVTCTPANGRTE